MALFANWLSRSTPFTDCPDFAFCEEIEGSREATAVGLRSAIADHLIGHALLAKLAGRPLALSAAVERIPTTARERSGDFGEVLAAEYVDEFTSFRVPLKRLRYKSDREFPMQGNDIIAISKDGDARLLKGEAKSLAKLDKRTADAADDALNDRGGRPKSETLGFLSVRLRELDKDDLAERVERFLDDYDDEQIEHLLFVVSGSDGREILRTRTTSKGQFRRYTVGVLIADHPQFIAQTFDALTAEIGGRVNS
jgi:hypothetical protein